jgi:hypothetical protein
MKSIYSWTLIGVMIFISFLGISAVAALQYTPGVKVGDEIVWEMQTEYLSYTCYVKHDIIAIYDFNESRTEVRVNESYTQSDETYLLSIQNGTRGVLEDYVQQDSIDDIILGYYWYIVPGTKIGLYVDYFSNDPNWENSTFTSINDGYGMEINDNSHPFGQFTHITCIYTENGILEKFYGEKGVDYFRNYDLYSINGKKYHTIPGFSVPIVLIGLFSGIIGLSVLKRKWKVS